MFMDCRNADNGSEINADVAIIGAGAAGITLAMELADSGLQVALIESGGFEIDADTQSLYDGKLTANENTDLGGSRLRYFGGSTNHWGGHCLPLEPIDFEKRSGLPYHGWPIGFEDLKPYYTRAQKYCDVGNFDYDPAKVLDLDSDDLLPFNPQLIRTVCDRQSGPTRFGEKYKEPLRTAKGIKVYLWANVIGLDQDEQGNVTHVRLRTLNGRELTAKARLFVLAGGGIENARLLLISNGLLPQGIGNQSDCVGRYFMDHLSGGVGNVHLTDGYSVPTTYTDMSTAPDGTGVHCQTRLADGVIRQRGLLNGTYWWTPIEEDPEAQELAVDARVGLQGLKNTVKYAIGRASPDTSLSAEFCSFINNSGAMTKRYVASLRGKTPRTFLLRFEVEQAPNPESRVTLSEDRDALGVPRAQLAWRQTDLDIESIKQTALVFGAELGRTGIGRLQLEQRDQLPYWGFSTAWHHMGTTRMAGSPASGVVDPNCKVFGTGNLFVAGSSCFPTSGRSNPTLTLVALTIRLADHFKQNWNRHA